MATVKLKIDGREVEVEKGTNLVDAGKKAGIFMPHFCYHPGLPVVGVCRICLCAIEGRPKLVAGCATPAEEGMNVITKSKAVRDARAAVMEFLLIHHPLDCPMCDKGGECTLQDYTVAMGAAHTRFSFRKNTWPEENVGGKLILNKNRCILCMRCVNLCADVAGQDEIAVIARGEETYIGTVGGRKIENELAGNIADICPVGALTSVDFRFESRPWELSNVKTICTNCSKGCNTVAGFHPRRNKILRVTARENMDVNQWWICDRGRAQFHQVHDVVRIANPVYRSRAKGGAGRAVAWADAIAQVSGAIRDAIARQGSDSVGVISSAELSNEELFLAGRIFRDGLGLSHYDFPERPQPPVIYPKFTIEGDKNPNTRGARLLGGAAGRSGRPVKEIIAAAAEGRIAVLLFLRGGSPETFGDPALVARALHRAGLVVVMDYVASAISDLADWALPGVSHFEKDGTYVNSQGRVQRARKVFTLRGDTREDWRVLQDLGSALGALHETDPSPESIFDRIARTVPAFTGSRTRLWGTWVRRSAPRRRTSPWGSAPRRRELLRALPKTDLHVHLDGSLRPATLLDLAAAQGAKLPFRTPRELSAAFARLASGVSLPEYLKAFDWTLAVLQDRASLERVAFELAEDASMENVRYMEVRYCPALHTRKRLTMEESVEAVRAGLRRAERATGIRTGTIICGIRHLSPRLSVRLADLASAYYGKGVVGFDLAGAEKDYPAKAHRRAFDRVKKRHVNITVHAGEAFGAASIDQAIRYCGAHRIGHGTRLREDKDVFAYVRDHRVPLEMCLVSNVQTGAVRSLGTHPFGRYLKAGLRVTVNTDNRLVSSTTMTDELERAVTSFRLSPADLRYVLINGFKSAFLPYEEKGALLRRALRDMDRILEEARAAEGERSRDLL